MSTIWIDAPEIQRIAETLIDKEDEFHDIRAHEPVIKYLFKSAKKSKELGKCGKSSGPWRHLTKGVDYVIFAWKEYWDEAPLNEREALVYHELMHIDIEEDDESGEIKFKIKKHDVETFISEVERYQDWRPELTMLKNVFDTGMIEVEAQQKVK